MYQKTLSKYTLDFLFPFSEPQTHVVRGSKGKQFINKGKGAVGINDGFFQRVENTSFLSHGYGAFVPLAPNTKRKRVGQSVGVAMKV